jgi:hypothetical protein
MIRVEIPLAQKTEIEKSKDSEQKVSRNYFLNLGWRIVHNDKNKALGRDFV